MKYRLTEHEVSTGLTDLGTVEQDLDVGSFGMIATFIKTVGNGSQAGAMTVSTVLDADFHLRLGHRLRNHVLYRNKLLHYSVLHLLQPLSRGRYPAQV